MNDFPHISPDYNNSTEREVVSEHHNVWVKKHLADITASVLALGVTAAEVNKFVAVGLDKYDGPTIVATALSAGLYVGSRNINYLVSKLPSEIQNKYFKIGD